MSTSTQLLLPGVEWIESPPPRLADGVHLIGDFKNSGLKAPTYLARRPDGQMVQMSRLLYLIARYADGRRSHRHIATLAGGQSGRLLRADDVRHLVDSRLIPAGIIAATTAARRSAIRADPLLALRLRAAILPERLVNGISVVFLPLFTPLVVGLVIAGLAWLDAWLLFFHSFGPALSTSLRQPRLLLMLLALLLASAAFHEFGHATACRYGGARPGGIGAGLYVVWPVFFSDVTDSYRLGRSGRLRTDLGGVYFNAIFMLLIAGIYAVTRFEPLLVLIPLQHIEVAHQLFPFLRLDGYYVLSDLTGVPDLFARLGPVLRSLVPGAVREQRVQALKPWARTIVTAWVVFAVATLAVLYLFLLRGLPGVLRSLQTSVIVQAQQLVTGLQHHEYAAAGLAATAIIGAFLPALALAWTMAQAGRLLLRWTLTRLARRSLGRMVFPTVAMAAAVAGLVIGVAWTQANRPSVRVVRELTPMVTGRAPAQPSPTTSAGLPGVNPSSGARGSTMLRPSATPAASPAPQPTAVPSASPSASPTPSPSADATPSPSPSQSPSPSPSPSPTPAS
jgi:putative peptide zinc metalloprotease protein